MNNIFDTDVVHQLIDTDMKDYIKFMEEVLALEMFTGLSREESIIKTLESYPNIKLKINR